MFYEKLKDGSVKCNLCRRHCIIPKGGVGVCNVRKNINGKLYSLVYGINTGLAIDPIEKKPFFHFLPGERVLSFGTVGCNWKCKFCQNWETSQSKEIFGVHMSPKEIVDTAKLHGIKIIGYTYNEPTIFYEYMYDTAILAKKSGLRNVMVTNGYIEKEPLKKLPIDAAVIDFKTFNEKSYLELSGGIILDELLKSVKNFKKYVPWIEITFLAVPGWTSEEDVRQFVVWIKENLGKKVPVHFIRFFPAYKMSDTPETKIEFLEKAYKIARDEGLEYVYIGNVPPGNPKENTYCPKCGKLLIKRYGYFVKKLFKDKCECGEKIPGVWE